ncbi:MAG: PLP-dependent aminotransferase family protein [Alphaproteobacteria bacterium]
MPARKRSTVESDTTGAGWLPDLSARRGPRYRAIVEAIAEDVSAHRLVPGTLLPPHRTLARRLGITVGTVTRAYDQAKRHGLVTGEVGRGTYVAEPPQHDGAAASGAKLTAELLDLRFNQPAVDYGSRALSETLKTLARRGNLNTLLDYQAAPGKEHHRLAGAKWVAKVGVVASPDQVVICNGAQQALMAAMATLTKPGDVVATEALNYPGIRRLASLFHVRLKGLAIDEEGLVPDAFAEACAAQRIAALICTPTIHNPTATTLPIERRRKIVEIAAAHGVPIVENDTYGQLPEDGLPPLYALGQGGCYYIGGTSKSLVPGLRIAYLVAPDPMVHRFADAVHATTWTTSSLVAEIAALWINDGTADAFIRWHRKEIATRQGLAAKYLGSLGYREHACSYHIWLPLAEPRRADEVVIQAQAAGVAISPGSVFAVEPQFIAQALRISLGAPLTLELLETGLKRLAAILETRAAFHHMVI